MARKTTRKKSADPAARLREAAMAFAAEGRWRDLSLAEIAQRAGLAIAEAYVIYPSKSDILRAQLRAVDEIVLSGTEADLGMEPARDRLFDVTMRRLDAMAPYKASIATILHDLGRDPLAAFCALPYFRRSLSAMLEAAGLSSEGLIGLVRIKALAAVYLATIRVWFRDESEDLSPTMAALDRNLTRLDKLVKSCRCAGRPLSRRQEG